MNPGRLVWITEEQAAAVAIAALGRGDVVLGQIVQAYRAAPSYPAEVIAEAICAIFPELKDVQVQTTQFGTRRAVDFAADAALRNLGVPVEAKP